MRPQQQNRRMRGRGGNNNNNNNSSNNRKGPNPLARSYESNGPDVKIRGTAQQVAEKYTTLARDSHSSGDRVMAENYLQHAEHYNRIIAAAQAQLQQQQQSARDNREDDDDADDRDAGEGNGNNGNGRNQRQQHIEDGSGPQPEIEGMPVELALKGGGRRQPNGNVNGHAAEGSPARDDAETSAKPAPKRARRPAVARTPDADGIPAGEISAGEVPVEEKAARRPRRPRVRKADEADATAPADDVVVPG